MPSLTSNRRSTNNFDGPSLVKSFSDVAMYASVEVLVDSEGIRICGSPILVAGVQGVGCWVPGAGPLCRRKNKESLFAG